MLYINVLNDQFLPKDTLSKYVGRLALFQPNHHLPPQDIKQILNLLVLVLEDAWGRYNLSNIYLMLELDELVYWDNLPMLTKYDAQKPLSGHVFPCILPKVLVVANKMLKYFSFKSGGLESWEENLSKRKKLYEVFQIWQNSQGILDFFLFNWH